MQEEHGARQIARRPVAPYVAVAVGGVAWGYLRVGLSLLPGTGSSASWPWITFAVNVAGTFVLALAVHPRREASICDVRPSADRHGLLRRADHVLDAAARGLPHAARGQLAARDGLPLGKHRRRMRGGRRRHLPRARREVPLSALAGWVGVGVLAALGALARFVLGGAIQRRSTALFPFGTLAVNTSGAFALGVLAGAGASGWPLRLAGAALLGSFTTFSTWLFESGALVEGGMPARRR